MQDGWYKLTSGNSMFIQHFTGSLTSTGYEAEEFRRLGYSFEPVVVLTVEEHKRLLATDQIATTMRQFSMERVKE